MKASAAPAADPPVPAGSAGAAVAEAVDGAASTEGWAAEAGGAGAGAGAAEAAAGVAAGVGEPVEAGATAVAGWVPDVEVGAGAADPAGAAVARVGGGLVLVVVGAGCDVWAGWVAGWERGTEAVPPVEAVGAMVAVPDEVGAEVLPDEELPVVAEVADVAPLGAGEVAEGAGAADWVPEPLEPEAVPPVAVGVQDPTAWPAHDPLVQVMGTT